MSVMLIMLVTSITPGESVQVPIRGIITIPASLSNIRFAMGAYFSNPLSRAGISMAIEKKKFYAQSASQMHVGHKIFLAHCWTNGHWGKIFYSQSAGPMIIGHRIFLQIAGPMIIGQRIFYAQSARPMAIGQEIFYAQSAGPMHVVHRIFLAHHQTHSH